MNRLRAAGALEFTGARRYGVVAIAGVLALLWTSVLAALPPAAAVASAPFLLFLDTAGFGALFALALQLFERAEGTAAARWVTPLRAGEAVAVRITVLTGLACAMAVPITVAAVVPTTAPHMGAALAAAVAGVALTSVLLLAVCMAVGARTSTLPRALLMIPAALVPMIAAPVVHLSGAVQQPLLFAVPTTTGAELIRLGTGGGSAEGTLAATAAYALVCAGAACWWAARSVERAEGGPDLNAGAGVAVRPDVRGAASRTGPAPAAGAAEHRHSRIGGRLGDAVRVGRFDLAGAGRDPLLLLVAAAPVPLALALRWALPPIGAYVHSAYGFDIAAYSGALFGALVLLHVPTMLGSVVALRVAEDVDDNTLLIVRVTPPGLRSYLCYRTAAAGVLALAGLTAAVPLSGLAPAMSPGLVAAVLPAAAYAPLIVLATAAFAGNKVEALVVLKGLGAISVLLPVLAWALPVQWWWPLLAVPPAWALLPLPGYAPGLLPTGAVLLCGAVSTAVVGWLLICRVRSSGIRQESR